MGLLSFIGGLIGSSKQAKATKQAAQLQYDAAAKGIAEQARQFDVTRADYQPFQALGYAGLEKFGDLAGLNGYEAQNSEISLLRESPIYKSLYRNGEEAVLANASATGGLRGGDTAGSLYNLGEDTLSGLIASQLATYGGAIGVGSGATDAVSSFGANAVAQQNQLRNQGAGAQAQSALIRGGLAAQNWQNAGTFIEDSIMSAFGGGGGGGFNWKSLF